MKASTKKVSDLTVDELKSVIHEVIAEVRRKRAEVIGVGVLVDLSKGEIDFGVPLFSCYQTSIPTYPPENCPLCAAKVPLTKPGSGENRST